MNNDDEEKFVFKNKKMIIYIVIGVLTIILTIIITATITNNIINKSNQQNQQSQINEHKKDSKISNENKKKESNTEIVELKNEYGNETYNMTSLSNNIIKYGDWIIFSIGRKPLKSNIINFEDGIYKYNTKTGQTIRLSKYNSFSLNVYNDWLYYITEYNRIYKVNLNNLQEDYLWVDDAENLLIHNGYIYYANNNGYNVYKMTINSGITSLIVEYIKKTEYMNYVKNFQIYNDDIYYIDGQFGKLFKKSITQKDSEPEKITDDEIDFFYVKDDFIIYESGINLKVYNCKTKEIEIEKTNINSNFVVEDNKIYCYSTSQLGIIEIDINSKEEKNIFNCENRISRLQLFDEYIYYDEYGGTYPNKTIYLYSVNIKTGEKKQITF